MIETDGTTYQSCKYAKALFASDQKVGKTSFLVASSLGMLPWQKHGGVVDDPSNLHVLTFDANAAGGLSRFLKETCGAPELALKFRIYNMQEDARRVSIQEQEWDYGFYSMVMSCLETISKRAKGVPVIIVSSLTGLAASLERALSGPPGQKRGNSMDQAKWADYSRQIAELRNYAQQDKWHMFWEAHVYRPPSNGQNQEQAKETLQISGKSGQNFGYNVEQVFRIRRNFGTPFGQTKCEQVFLDTRPSMEFIANGRGFTEALEPRESDLTKALQKLGLEVGGWRAK